MTKDENFKLLKIQTCALRVNIHCDGCKQKVKKVLQRIEGVYQVNIDAEEQKVTISGSLDSEALIKKLVRAGKHAELWSEKNNQSPKQKVNAIKDDKNKKGQKQNVMMKDLEALKNQQKYPFMAEEDDVDDENEEVEDDEELQFIRERSNQLNLLRQQAMDASNVKNDIAAMVAAANNAEVNNTAVGKKGNPSQNMGMKVNHPGGIDQKTIAELKMNNAQFGGGSMNPEDQRRGNDINTIMNLAGFHGNSGNNLAAVLGGGNSSGLGGGYQLQSTNPFQGNPSSDTAVSSATGQHPPLSMIMNPNGYPHHQQQYYNQPTSMMMMNRHGGIQQQPQMMYHRSPLTTPASGYYYHYQHPIPYNTSYNSEPSYSIGYAPNENDHSFCSIM